MAWTEEWYCSIYEHKEYVKCILYKGKSPSFLMVNLILYVYPERGYLLGALQFILMESTHEQTENSVLDIIFIRNTETNVRRIYTEF